MYLCHERPFDVLTGSFKLFRVTYPLCACSLPPSALLLTESHLSSTIPNCTALAWQSTCWTVGAIPSVPRAALTNIFSGCFLECPYACRVKSFCSRLTISSLPRVDNRPVLVPLPSVFVVSLASPSHRAFTAARARRSPENGHEAIGVRPWHGLPVCVVLPTAGMLSYGGSYKICRLGLPGANVLCSFLLFVLINLALTVGNRRA